MPDLPQSVSIIIVHFHSGDYIFECLEHVFQQDYPIEIIVVDNDSNDAASDRLVAMARRGVLRYYPQTTNLGFSAANNIGIQAANGPYILTLNADVFLDQHYVQRAVIHLQSDESIGTVTGKLRSHSEESTLDSTGIVLFRDGTAIDRGFGEKDHGQYDQPEYLLGACAAAALYRRAMLDDISIGSEYFNEDFFAFLEDVDLATRATLLGWKTYYDPTATARHVRGGSTGSVSAFVKHLKLRNELLLYYQLLRHNNRGFSFKFFAAHHLLGLARWLTNSPRVMFAVRKEFRSLRSKMDHQNAAICHRYNYANLNQHINGSYVIHRLKERWRVIFKNRKYY